MESSLVSPIFPSRLSFEGLGFVLNYADRLPRIILERLNFLRDSLTPENFGDGSQAHNIVLHSFSLFINLQTTKASCGGDYITPRSVQCAKLVEAVKQVRGSLPLYYNLLRLIHSCSGVIYDEEPEWPECGAYSGT